MFEKVNLYHPDKVADRIAGAIVDLCYTKNENPKVAVEVLIGHGVCHVIAETSEKLEYSEVDKIVTRIAGKIKLDLVVVPQDKHLANNQSEEIRCGDNGIFKGMPTTDEQKQLTFVAKLLTFKYPFDGKYIINDDKLTICQSNADTNEIKKCFGEMAVVNPLGDWTGGTDVDSGVTNRKLGSDMGDAVTGGGLHGKDLSKADVTLNIQCYILANNIYNKPIYCTCNIGDVEVTFYNKDGKTLFTKNYKECVKTAKYFIKNIGGFEALAEWGLIR